MWARAGTPVKPVETPFGVFTARSLATLKLAALREPFQLQLMRHCFARMEELTTLADVGANLGLYSVFASQLPECDRIIAFEPGPTTYPALADNIALNPRAKANATLHQLAVSDKPGAVPFAVVGDLSPGAKIASPEDGGEIVEVEATRIDDVISPLGPRDVFMKMDVEGHELAALAGAAGLLAHRCAVAQIEVLREPRTGRRDVRAAMRAAGFQLLFRVGADHIFLHRDVMRYAPQMREMFWDKSQAAGHLLMQAGLAPESFASDGKSRAGLARYFNGFLSALR